MQYRIIVIIVHILSFALSFYALENIRFEKFCRVDKPKNVVLLLFLLSMALGYLVAQFLLAITLYVK